MIKEARSRQVIVFTHDLVFLNNLVHCAEEDGVEYQAHWVDRDADGNPGCVALNDAPATSRAYETTQRAKEYLAQAKTLSGKSRHVAICDGMAALRRTIEETVAKRLFKDVVGRWSDRVMVTKVTKIAWDNQLADELCATFEELSKYIEGHSHTDEAMGAPPEIGDLEKMIKRVENLIQRAKPERKKEQQPAAAA